MTIQLYYYINIVLYLYIGVCVYGYICLFDYNYICLYTINQIIKNMKLISFQNLKGGVGKSTLTSMVANYFHKEKKKKLIVLDCDPRQGTLIELRKDEIEESENDNYQLVKINPENAYDYIKDVFNDYDFIFIDLPGSLDQKGVLTAIHLIDYVFIPTRTNKTDLRSTFKYIDVYNEKVKPWRNEKDLDISLNLVINFAEANTLEHKEFYENKDSLTINVLDNSVPKLNNIARNISTINVYKDSTKDKERLKMFCEEIYKIIN